MKPIKAEMNARRDERKAARAAFRAELRAYRRHLSLWQGWGFFIPPMSKRYRANQRADGL